jgi:glycogen phosphorylase
VREYTEQHYLPAAAAYRTRAADKGAVGRAVFNWEQTLKLNWATIHFGEVKFETCGGQHVFEVQTYLGEVDPDSVRVELYANGINGESPVWQEMKPVRQLVGAANGYVYSARVAATRPVTDYTARIIPCCVGTAVPLEAARILWQR